MAIADKLRAKVGGLESANSLAAKARARRWEMFARHFPDVSRMRVLDLGGTAATWQSAPVTPAHVTVVNLDIDNNRDDGAMRQVRGDACALPSAVAAGSFDLVFSNSLIEHVGGHERRLRLAETIREMAPHHWVQTPYRYFPIEPHWIFPGFQFLPLQLRVAISRRWQVGHIRSAGKSREEAIHDVAWVELLSLTEMALYFPDSQILHERFAGLTKSLIAVRSGTPQAA